MQTKLRVNGEEILVKDKNKIGDGGEAIVYDISSLISSGTPTALKLWRKPTDDVYASVASQTIERNNREGAAKRLATYPEKLKHFPKGLPLEVVAPKDPAIASNGSVVGFTMPLLTSGVRLSMFAKRDYKTVNGITPLETMKVFMSLWDTVRALHKAGVVIGDFNNKNVLEKEFKAYLVDADSMQFGSYTAPGFTPGYVDPLICDPNKKYPEQVRPHTKETDWYAFAVMLFECLMETHPFFGGAYRPKTGLPHVPLDARSLHGISVFSDGVIYSMRAVPLDWLPIRAAEYFKRIFDTKGKPLREEFSREILEMLATHAGLAVQIEPRQVQLNVSQASFAFRHERLLQVAFQNGSLRFLEKGSEGFMRDGSHKILSGTPERGWRYRLMGDSTLIAVGNRLIVIGKDGSIESQVSVDTFRGQKPVFDSNNDRYFWVQGGKLYGSKDISPQYIGDVLEGQTLLWIGQRCGVGLSQIGASWSPFMFSTDRVGINDSIKDVSLSGELLDAQVYFSPEHVWLLVAIETQNVVTNFAYLLDLKGQVIATASAKDGDSTWLGSIRGHVGATRLSKPGTPILYGLGDNEIHRVEVVQGSLQETAHSSIQMNPASPPTRLFFDPKGELLLIGTKDVTTLKL
jgi:hypothetical protein